jgi:hypothetical protein
MRIILSLVYGFVLGAAAVLLHNAYQPWGLALSLIGSGLGIWLIGRAWGLRRYKFLAAFTWCALIFIASKPGVGGEILVLGNSMGNALVIGGFFTLCIAVSITD